MKKCIIILFALLPVLLQAQVFPIGSWKRNSYIVPAEYITTAYDSVNHQWYQAFVSFTPTLWTNQPAYSQWGGGGPHDAIVCDTLGVVRTSGNNNVGQCGIGSTSPTTSGAFVTVTTDSAGNTLPPMAGYLMTLNPTNGENWFTVLRSTVASGGKVYVAGCTQDGIRGN